jgi:hypothetical protein
MYHTNTQRLTGLFTGTKRVFRLREVVPTGEANARRSRTFNIPLLHNSVRLSSFCEIIADETDTLQLTIMHASCQERFKHSIPPQSTIDLYRPAYPPTPDALVEPSSCRINITFRFYRPDFKPESLPRCKCGIPTILRPDMKYIDKANKYWWCCYAGAQNDGKGCDYWRCMDMKNEGRGPCIDDCAESESSSI